MMYPQNSKNIFMLVFPVLPKLLGVLLPAQKKSFKKYSEANLKRYIKRFKGITGSVTRILTQLDLGRVKTRGLLGLADGS